jgi:ribosomal protein S18 acetylase RimI-like enzyme
LHFCGGVMLDLEMQKHRKFSMATLRLVKCELIIAHDLHSRQINLSLTAIKYYMNITTRNMSASDIVNVAELFDLYRQFYQQPANPQLAYDFIHDRFMRGESLVLVAESAEAGILGFCQLYPTFCSVEAAPIYSLYDLFVLPEARKSGAGRQLLLAAEAQAAAEGKVRMDLTTAKTNLPAQSLYEALGWVRDEVFYGYSRKISGR